MKLKLISMIKFPPENTPRASHSITIIDYSLGFLERCKSEVKYKAIKKFIIEDFYFYFYFYFCCNSDCKKESNYGVK